MNINRNNYEEFFMLYADNELAAAERKAVELFVAANPDLQEELASFQQFKLIPDDAIVFADKEALIKQESAGDAISITNYETFFVLYADDELNNKEKSAVEDFVYHHPQLQTEFELLQQVKLNADTTILFKNKESLYRKEEDDKVVPFRWWRIAVAAIVLLLAGLFWLLQSKKEITPAPFVKNNLPAVTNPQQHPLQIKGEKNTTTNTDNYEQPVKEEPLVKNAQKEKQPGKSVQPAQAVVVRNNGNNNKATGDKSAPVNDNTIAQHEGNTLNDGDNHIKASAIASIKNNKEVDINTGIAAAASKSVVNDQLVYYSNSTDNKTIAEQAVATSDNNLEVLNTSVDTKNSLRGFFRKASRLINKKNSDEENSKHKSILIGGFEIAVR